jgi:hypothetical protein
MVQKSRALNIALAVLLRILLIVVASIIGLFFFPITIHDFVINTLGYIVPSGFFGFTFADWDVAWIISSALWVGILLGTLGKRIDYAFILLFFITSSFEYLYTENMTLLVYSGLVGATIIGNIIGFGLKLLRQKYWAK